MQQQLIDDIIDVYYNSDTDLNYESNSTLLSQEMLESGCYAMQLTSTDMGRKNGRYNQGFEYKIVPLTSNLSQRGNDLQLQKKWIEDESKRIYVGMTVSGYSKKDKKAKKHIGRVINFSYSFDNPDTIRYIWILEDETSTKWPLSVNTVKIIDNHKKPIKKFNLFASNYMHVYESYDIFNNFDDDVDVDDELIKENILYKNADTDAERNEVVKLIKDAEKKKIDDSWYRNQIVKIFQKAKPFQPVKDYVYNYEQYIQIFDDIFYNIEMTCDHLPCISFPKQIYNYLTCIDSDDSFVKGRAIFTHIKYFISLYSEYMGIYEIINPDKKLTAYTVKLDYNSGLGLNCNSYKSLYMMLKTLKHIHNMSIHRPGAQINIDEYKNKRLLYTNLTTNSPDYYRYFVSFLLIFCFDELPVNYFKLKVKYNHNNNSNYILEYPYFKDKDHDYIDKLVTHYY